jgi:class 3 adenylate cyclase
MSAQAVMSLVQMSPSHRLPERVNGSLLPACGSEHYAVLTRAVREHDGAVVKTIGDAVMAAFSSPADGLAAARSQFASVSPSSTAGWRGKPVRAAPFRSRSACIVGRASP